MRTPMNVRNAQSHPLDALSKKNSGSISEHAVRAQDMPENAAHALPASD